jgi:hypothetical protein
MLAVLNYAGRQQRGWMRRCATSPKVPGSNPDDSTTFLIYLILPAALRRWGRLRNLPVGKTRPARKAHLTATR